MYNVPRVSHFQKQVIQFNFIAAEGLHLNLNERYYAKNLQEIFS